jgi:hypothetical protein
MYNKHEKKSRNENNGKKGKAILVTGWCGP